MLEINTTQVKKLYQVVKDIYTQGPDLPFHGWHHIEFVYDKAKVFADDLGADINLTQSAALVHDLNYLVTLDAWTPPSEGESLRSQALLKAGYSEEQIKNIENIVLKAETVARDGQRLSAEMKALSDADTLFKALPTTTPVFAARFMAQTNYSLLKLARKIVSEQAPLIETGQYFYSNLANEKYLDWAKENLQIWKNIEESVKDPHILKMLKQANVNLKN